MLLAGDKTQPMTMGSPGFNPAESRLAPKLLMRRGRSAGATVSPVAASIRYESLPRRLTN
jgi:hypothetical protein